MPYVMVPVPEEFENEVTQAVLRLTLSAALNRWDAPSVERLVGALASSYRSVVATVAEAALGGRVVSDHEVAAAMGVAPNEVIDVCMHVNAVCVEIGSPALILIRTEFEDLDRDERRMVRRLLVNADAAGLVVAAIGQHGV